MIVTRRQFFEFAGALSLALARSDTKLTAPPQSIPRSSDWADDRFPPWNLSPKIDDNGFLRHKYSRIPGDWEMLPDDSDDEDDNLGKHTQHLQRKPYNKRNGRNVDPASLLSPEDIMQLPVRIRQVPGDGNCLFHSVTTCYVHAKNGTHINMKDPDALKWLYHHSTCLRQKAVDCLEQYLHPAKLRSNHDKTLFLQGGEYLKTSDLVEAAASQYGISGPEYCKIMRENSVWGGGPEIVALSNVLRRPIHVYELHVPESGDRHSGSFVLRRMACFGSPNFDDRTALHILSADSKFPDVEPGSQLASGNHFMALFPQWSSCEEAAPTRLRGGDADGIRIDCDDCSEPTTFDRAVQFWKRYCAFW